MIAQYLPKNSQAAIVVSIKNGAWFESKEERGFTHLAEYCIQRMVIDGCNAAGLDESTFAVRGDTSADRVRFAVFCQPKDVTRVAKIVRQCLEHPIFTVPGIREETRLLRMDYIDSFRNPYFRAQRAVMSTCSRKNPSVFGSTFFHLVARGPVPEQLLKYWNKFWSASARDVLMFGACDEECVNIAGALSYDVTSPLKTFSVQDHRTVATRYAHGVAWRETCFTPIYTLFVRVMEARKKAADHGTKLLMSDRAEWRVCALLSRSSKTTQQWNTLFGKDISRDEWQHAKEMFAKTIDVVLSGAELQDDIFYWDDCTPVAYGQFGITSLHDLSQYVANSSFDEFQSYWSATITRT